MAPITESVEIGRRPEDVFAYLDDLTRHAEWQDSIVGVEPQTEGPTRVGTRVRQTRRTPGGTQTLTYEVTEHDPPRRSSFRGIDGPVRPAGTITVEPVGDGSRSRVTIELDLEGHGMGKLIAPLARSQARKEVPKNQAQLKERLESGV
jgi:uncharacterized membrane protein